MDNKLREEIAMFRFGVIAPLVGRQLGRGERELIIREITSATWRIPGCSRTSIGRSTVLKWVSGYQRSGGDITSLFPRERSDRGTVRSIEAETEAALVELKRQKPELSLPVLLRLARERKVIDEGFTASPQSVYRLFARHGLNTAEHRPVDRRRFEAELPNDLWQSDAMHGPRVLDGGRQRKSYLFAIIDDHSRLIAHSGFYLSEGIASFRDCLIQAMSKRGLPRKLYTDNGSAFRSHQLRFACVSLGVALLHSEPGVPEGRGKIERFFRTVRTQFLPPLAERLMSLEELNQRWSQWVDTEYHQRVHGSTGTTPLKRYLQYLHALRSAPKDLRDYFRVPARRKVDKDRSVSLNGRLFEAPVGLIGRSITLLYHPEDPLRVEALFDGKSYGFLLLLNPGINSRVRRLAKQETELLPGEREPSDHPDYRGGSLFTDEATS